jgi:hypothetical protein
MTKAKPRYNGPPTFAESVKSGDYTELPDFPESLRLSLHEILREHTKAKISEGQFPSYADRFSNEVLAEARQVRAELEHLRLGINKSDLREENQQLALRIRAAINKIKKAPKKHETLGFADLANKLRRMSPDLDRLLGVEIDPRGAAVALESYATGKLDAIHCLSELSRLLDHIGTAGLDTVIDDAPEKLRDSELLHWSAVDLAARIDKVFEDFRLASSNHANAYTNQASALIKVLDRVGRELKIRFSLVTWQAAVREARLNAKNGGT